MTPKLDTLLASGHLFTLARPYWKPPFSYDAETQSIYDNDSNMILDICGYRRLRRENDLSEGHVTSIQNELGEHLALLLNAAWTQPNAVNT